MPAARDIGLCGKVYMGLYGEILKNEPIIEGPDNGLQGQDQRDLRRRDVSRPDDQRQQRHRQDDPFRAERVAREKSTLSRSRALFILPAVSAAHREDLRASSWYKHILSSEASPYQAGRTETTLMAFFVLAGSLQSS